MQDFRRLLVWQRAHVLALDVRRATRTFPRTGYASLKAQMVGSGDSVPFNIVEGCGAASQREFARFLDMSIKSSTELEYQLQLARDCDVLTRAAWQRMTREVVEIRRMLCGLRTKVLTAAADEDRRAREARSGPRRSEASSKPPRLAPDNSRLGSASATPNAASREDPS